MTDWNFIITQINQSLKTSENYASSLRLSGGSINQAYRISTDNNQHYFVKLNHASFDEMFSAEYEALLELQQAEMLHCPKPVCTGSHKDQCYIVIEYIPLSQQGNQQKLGQGLAQMHRITARQYGWHRDNTIGSTPQHNTYSDNWTDFWLNQRLLPQFEMLYDKGYRSSLEKKAETLMQSLSSFFVDHQPQASLLHGDLWSGNYAFDDKGSPVIFDPALYYGDRETDLAMTELFGGFGADFYQAYNETYPLSKAYKKRKTMYNLYHILNHGNLFGGSYVMQAEHMIDQLIKELF